MKLFLAHLVEGKTDGIPDRAELADGRLHDAFCSSNDFRKARDLCRIGRRLVPRVLSLSKRHAYRKLLLV